MPNSVAKRVVCIDWQPLLGSFTWKDWVPKYVTVLCKATNVLSTPSSIIFWTRIHSHEHILKTYPSGIPPPQKLHSPITAFSHPTFISPTLNLIHTLNLIFTFIQDSSLQSFAHFCVVPASSQLYFLPYPVWTTRVTYLVWLGVCVGSRETHRWYWSALGRAMALLSAPLDWDLNIHIFLTCLSSGDAQLTCPQPPLHSPKASSFKVAQGWVLELQPLLSP